jgi:hypothetical protein
VQADAGIVDAAACGRFVAAAKTRPWAREGRVRTLA